MKFIRGAEKFVNVITYVALILPLVTFAQAATGKPPLFENLTEVAEKLCVVFQWVFTFALIASFIFIVIAGIRYITAGGNPEKVKGATQALIWGVVGIAVALIARGVPLLIATFLGTTVDRPTGC